MKSVFYVEDDFVAGLLKQYFVGTGNSTFFVKRSPNGNLASQRFIDKAILDDKTIYPDDAMMSRLYVINARDPKTERLMNRLWIRIKTGR